MGGGRGRGSHRVGRYLRLGWPAALLGAGYGVPMGLGLLGARTGASTEPVMALGMITLGLAGLGLALRCWRHRALAARTRRAWGIMSIAFVLALVFPFLYAVFPPSDSMIFGPGDVLRLAFTIAFMTGLLAFPVRPAGRHGRWKAGLDVATVVVSGCMVLWYVMLGPGIAPTGDSFATLAIALALPVSDILLIFAMATVLLRGTDPSTRGPVSLLAGSAAFAVAGDVYVGYILSHGLSESLITGWPLLLYLTSRYLLAAAALQQYRQAGRSSDRSGRRPHVPASSRMPYVAVGVAYSLLVVAALAERRVYPWIGLVLGAIGITALVTARQAVLQRESHRMAVTDGLTGLANRVRLYDALHHALERAARAGENTAVVLADLNGFKKYNDSLGHQAGDQVLVAFGRMLRRGVLGSDVVARLGGDEFAVVLRNIGDRANVEAVLRRVLTEMAEPAIVAGSPIQIRASFGAAVSGPGELGMDDLMHRADLAMYRAKRRGTTGWAWYDPATDDALESLADDLHRAVG